MKHKSGQAYLFLTPFLILVLIFYVIPAVLTIATSFTGLDPFLVWEFNNFKNSRKIFLDPSTITTVRNTCIFVGVAIAATMVLDLMLVILTTHFIRTGKYSSIFKSVLMISMITPAVVYSILWTWLLEANENGVTNKIYLTFEDSESIGWITKYPIQIVLLATTLTSIAYGTTIFSSTIKSIPDDQFKVAHVDGAGEWEIVKSVILPNIRYRIQFIALWETLGLLTNYVTILLVTNGRPGIKTEVWALSAYHKAFTDQQHRYGAAISLVLILIVLVLMILLNKVMQKQNGRQEGGCKMISLSKTEKKKQRITIIAMILLCLPILYLYLSLFRLAFFGADGRFTLHNFDFMYKEMKLKQTTIKPIGKAFRNAILFTVAVTACEVVISCLPGYVPSRLEFRGRKLTQNALLVLRMFPNLLLLIAVLYVLMALKLVNTLLGVVLVVIAFRIPGSTFIIKNFSDGIPRDAENSTLVDGCNRLLGFFQVIIYLVKPGIASISIFSFLSVWSNHILFNTLILNSKTLTIAIYLRSLSRSEQMIADYGVSAAMAIAYMLPVSVFFITSQKQLTEDNTGGGKGV